MGGEGWYRKVFLLEALEVDDLEHAVGSASSMYRAAAEVGCRRVHVCVCRPLGAGARNLKPLSSRSRDDHDTMQTQRAAHLRVRFCGALIIGSASVSV